MKIKNWFKKKNKKKIVPKFGVSFALFDGEELFESSLKNVRSMVDYVNVVY